MNSKWSETKATVLRFAADYASLHGLTDLTYGLPAKETGVSKAGLHGAFGSKTDLQVATAAFAAEIFENEVFTAARELPPGPERVQVFCDAWLAYVDRKVFPGGCFFGRVSMEGASLPEEVRGEIRRSFGLFRRFLAAGLGSGGGEFADQLLALVVSYNWALNSMQSASMGKNIRKLIRKKLSERE